MKLTLFQTFAIPLFLGLCTLAGLGIGMIADGWWDWLAVAALTVPNVVVISILLRQS